MEKLYVYVGNAKNSGCRWTTLIKKAYGYRKIPFSFFEMIFKPSVLDELIERGCYITGQKSVCDSSIYVQRFIASLYYVIVGFDAHHLNKIRSQNDIWNIVPIEEKLHKQLDGWTDSDRALNRAIELKKELQIKQFAETKSTNYSVKRSCDSILEILKLKAQGLSAKEIIKKMKNKLGERKIREYLKTFYHAEEFVAFYESQTEEDFSDLYANLDEKWRFVTNWEKSKDKTLSEFEAFKFAKLPVVKDLADIEVNSNNNADNYYGHINLDAILEEIF